MPCWFSNRRARSAAWPSARRTRPAARARRPTRVRLPVTDRQRRPDRRTCRRGSAASARIFWSCRSTRGRAQRLPVRLNDGSPARGRDRHGAGRLAGQRRQSGGSRSSASSSNSPRTRRTIRQPGHPRPPRRRPGRRRTMVIAYRSATRATSSRVSVPDERGGQLAETLQLLGDLGGLGRDGQHADDPPGAVPYGRAGPGEDRLLDHAGVAPADREDAPPSPGRARRAVDPLDHVADPGQLPRPRRRPRGRPAEGGRVLARRATGVGRRCRAAPGRRRTRGPSRPARPAPGRPRHAAWDPTAPVARAGLRPWVPDAGAAAGADAPDSGDGVGTRPTVPGMTAA